MENGGILSQELGERLGKGLGLQGPKMAYLAGRAVKKLVILAGLCPDGIVLLLRGQAQHAAPAHFVFAPWGAIHLGENKTLRLPGELSRRRGRRGIHLGSGRAQRSSRILVTQGEGRDASCHI